jgi:hypothetical protein
MREGNWDDVWDAMKRPNVIRVAPGPAGIYVTFAVHGIERERTYIYRPPGVKELEAALELIELLELL